MTHRQFLLVGANTALAVIHFTVYVYQFLILPLWLLPLDASWSWTLLPLAFMHNPYWSLIHEAIHDLFHPAPGINMLFGRAAAVAFGAPFRILRLSHLLHHKLNRTPMAASRSWWKNRKGVFSRYPKTISGSWRESDRGGIRLWGKVSNL